MLSKGKKMAKETFSHDIESNILKMFEEMCDALGTKKFRVLEAAIETFAALPWQYRLVLSSADQSQRQLYLDLIRRLGVPAAKPASEKARTKQRSG